MTFDLRNFRVGHRVELHPATDLWMRGARFGTVVRVGRKYLLVRLDRLLVKVKVAPRDICKILD